MQTKLLLTTLLAVCLLGACTQGKLAQAVDAADKACPIDLGDESRIQSIELDGGSVRYTINVPEEDGFTVDQFGDPIVRYLLKYSYLEVLPTIENDALRQLLVQTQADSALTVLHHIGDQSKLTIDLEIQSSEWNLEEE